MESVQPTARRTVATSANLLNLSDFLFLLHNRVPLTVSGLSPVILSDLVPGDVVSAS